MALVAVASVAIATLLANNGLQAELQRSARDRLQTTAMHLAELGADLHDSGSSMADTTAELAHIAAFEGLLVAVRDPEGGLISGSARLGSRAAASEPINARGGLVGTVSTAPADREAFEKADLALHRRLNRLHTAAGFLAGLLALGAALLISVPLTRPLRRLTEGAERMQRGELDVRVKPTGGVELEGLARALNELASTLELEERLRRDAAADLGHELRTPVTGLITRIEAAQDDMMADPAANLAAMHDEATRLARLTEDLARLTDAQRPGIMLEKKQLDLAEIAQRRADADERAFSEKELRLERDLQSAPVSGDAGRLEQLVENLLSNALRYSDPGGTVTLRTFCEGDESVLQVEDSGMGIAEDEIDHVFERFWRSEKSRARIHGGAGIGLAIVAELARGHGGVASVESRIGEGSTFSVRFPLRSGGTK